MPEWKLGEYHPTYPYESVETQVIEDADGTSVCGVSDEAMTGVKVVEVATRIIRCVNSHDALVEQLQIADAVLDIGWNDAEVRAAVLRGIQDALKAAGEEV